MHEFSLEGRTCLVEKRNASGTVQTFILMMMIVVLFLFNVFSVLWYWQGKQGHACVNIRQHVDMFAEIDRSNYARVSEIWLHPTLWTEMAHSKTQRGHRARQNVTPHIQRSQICVSTRSTQKLENLIAYTYCDYGLKNSRVLNDAVSAAAVSVEWVYERARWNQEKRGQDRGLF